VAVLFVVDVAAVWFVCVVVAEDIRELARECVRVEEGKGRRHNQS